jgi:hypothetical protein
MDFDYQQDTLLTSQVPRSLETKAKIMGLELSDIIILLLNLSIQNLIFGSTSFKYIMVIGTSLVMGLVLFFFKKGKPDHYLQHFIEHLLSPTIRDANLRDTKYRKFGGKKL